MAEVLGRINAAAKPGRSIPEYQDLAFELINKSEDVDIGVVVKHLCDDANSEPAQYILFDLYTYKLMKCEKPVER